MKIIWCREFLNYFKILNYRKFSGTQEKSRNASTRRNFEGASADRELLRELVLKGIVLELMRVRYGGLTT